jgi:Flp pilus assembly pilin Flp
MQPVAYALLADENGQGLVEYSLVLALVALAALASMTYFGRKVNNNLGSSSQLIQSLS